MPPCQCVLWASSAPPRRSCSPTLSETTTSTAMGPEQTVAMHDARRHDSQRKHTLVLAALETAVQAGLEPTIATVARRAGVGRKFVYDHPDLRAEIELKAAQATRHQVNDMLAAARVTGAS